VIGFVPSEIFDLRLYHALEFRISGCRLDSQPES
jgi:hypothetical protein